MHIDSTQSITLTHKAYGVCNLHCNWIQTRVTSRNQLGLNQPNKKKEKVEEERVAKKEVEVI